MLLLAIGSDNRRRRGRLAAPVVRAARYDRRRSTLNSAQVSQVAWTSRRYVFGALRARTLKRPIQRGESNDREGSGVCSVSSSTSSPTANCTSRR